MDLWIRSQNKEILQKTNALFITHSEENIWSIIDNQNMTKYGTYKTYERALEVLDEIQNIINAKTIIKFQCFVPEERIKQVKEAIDKYSIIELPDYEIKQLASVIIYEMPEE